MKVIVGLGNVGEKYARTRHNVGFVAIDKLTTLVKNKNIILSKPDTMMNASGIAVKKLIENKKIKLDDLFIIHDDLDIRLGEYKIQKGKGPKIHKGINSIEDTLGTSDFWRVRVGVDNRHSEIARGISRGPIPLDAKISNGTGREYVLEDFTAEEKIVIDRVIEEVCKKLARL